MIYRVEVLSSNTKVVQYFFLTISLSAIIPHLSKKIGSLLISLLSIRKCPCVLQPPTNFAKVLTWVQHMLSPRSTELHSPRGTIYIISCVKISPGAVLHCPRRFLHICTKQNEKWKDRSTLWLFKKRFC